MQFNHIFLLKDLIRVKSLEMFGFVGYYCYDYDFFCNKKKHTETDRKLGTADPCLYVCLFRQRNNATKHVQTVKGGTLYIVYSVVPGNKIKKLTNLHFK